MKKINFILALVLCVFLSLGPAFATNGPPPNNGPGWYEKIHGQNAGELKYFPNGHPENQSEWKWVGLTPPDNLNIANETSIASPFFKKEGDGFYVVSGGTVEVHSYAQGTLYAEALAVASGTAFGFGGQKITDTENGQVGMSGAIGVVCLGGFGEAIGIDKPSFFKNPDKSFVDISYEGYAYQGNSVFVGNDLGTGAGGGNETGVKFSGGSSDSSNGTGTISFGRYSFTTDAGFPAISGECAGGCGYAGGFTIASYEQTPLSAKSGALTVGFSGYNAEKGNVFGEGQVAHQAFVQSGASFGLSQGQASFSYSGYSDFGAGYAKSFGTVNIVQGPNVTSVTAVSQGSAGAFTGGGMPVVYKPAN